MTSLDLRRAFAEISRPWTRVRAVCVSAGVSMLLVGGSAGAQSTAGTDSVVQRARRMVNEGRAPESRALLDSLVNAARPGTTARADALYWRAVLAPDSASAERDYITIAVDHELAPRAADALLWLGTVALARGDRESARTLLERVILEHRARDAAADAWYHLGRMRLVSGDLTGGCAALDSARARLRPTDVERRGQVAFAAQSCRVRPAAAPPADSARTGAAAPPGTSGAPPAATPPARATERGDSAAGRWSVQVGAFKTRAEAERQVGAMKARGHTAHVDSLALFHVRIGAFATRTAANALVARLRAQGITGFVVEARPRER